MESPPVRITLLAPGFPRERDTGPIEWTSSSTQSPWQSQLSALLGQSAWSAQHLPTAELARSSQKCDFSSFDSQPVVSLAGSDIVCADPVHLRADRDSATLLPPESLNLADRESQALQASINEFLASDGLHVSQTSPDRWYMSGRNADALLSFPPSFLAHRNAAAYLTEGDASRSWRQLTTELQMLLHTHPVNVERERTGRLPVNSVWFWGGAALDAAIEMSETQRQSIVIHADDSFSCALARHLGIRIEPLGAFNPESEQLMSQTILIDGRLSEAFSNQDDVSLQAAEQHIRRALIAPLQSRIEAGELLEMVVLNEDGASGLLDASSLQRYAQHRQAKRPSRGAGNDATGAKLPLHQQLGRLWRRLTGADR